MNIEAHVRNATSQYLRSLIIKDKCEFCNTYENLVLHHIKPFSIILEECLEDLGYDYKKERNDYSELEVKNITNYMLGSQLQTEYLTLCNTCHIEHHADIVGNSTITDKHNQYYIDRARVKEIKRIEYTNNVVVPYLDSILGKRIFRDDGGVEELYNIVDYKVDRKTQRSYRKLNYSFKEVFDIPYKIIAKKTNKKRYWIVEKVQQQYQSNK